MAICTTRFSMTSWRRALPAVGLAAVVLLSACSSSNKKPQPAELPPVAALMGTQVAWSAQVGESHASLAPLFVAGKVFAAGNSGTVVAIDATTGKDAWRLDLKTPIAAGVGSDGQTAAVVTRNNQLVAIGNGDELWRVRLPARSFTAPLVADRRGDVFMAQGKTDEAKAQYQSAWQALGARTEYRRLVEVKLASLGVDAASLSSTAR